MKGTLSREFSRVAVILIMLWKACDTLLIFDSDGYNSNHNYGYLFKKIGEVYLSTGEAKVLFHYRLPDPINKTKMGSVNCKLMVGRHLHCASTSHLIEMVANIKDRTMTHLSSTIKHIYDVTTDWKESPRNKRSWWSSGWSSFTGLAQKTDLERLTHYLQKVETGVYHAVESWQSGSSNFITALEAEKKRVDNIDNLLASQRESILTLQEEIVQQYHEQVGFSRLMTNLITEYLIPMFLTTTDADVLYDSIQLLNSGILPHHFVSHTKLRLAFTLLDQSLSTKHPNLTILIREPTFYYRHPDFQTFRHDKYLLIAVQVPLTVKQLTQNGLD